MSEEHAYDELLISILFIQEVDSQVRCTVCYSVNQTISSYLSILFWMIPFYFHCFWVSLAGLLRKKKGFWIVGKKVFYLLIKRKGNSGRVEK